MIPIIDNKMVGVFMWVLLIIIIAIVVFFVVKNKKEPDDQNLEFLKTLQRRNEDNALRVFDSTPRDNIDYNFEIVGEQAYQHNLKKLAGEKEEESKFVEVVAKVSSEPNNQLY